MTISRIFLLIALLTLLLPACGQRGPLYLPDEGTSPAVPAQASEAPVPPDPLDAGFEDESNKDDEQPEDEQADGL